MLFFVSKPSIYCASFISQISHIFISYQLSHLLIHFLNSHTRSSPVSALVLHSLFCVIFSCSHFNTVFVHNPRTFQPFCFFLCPFTYLYVLSVTLEQTEPQCIWSDRLPAGKFTPELLHLVELDGLPDQAVGEEAPCTLQTPDTGTDSMQLHTHHLWNNRVDSSWLNTNRYNEKELRQKRYKQSSLTKWKHFRLRTTNSES